jgi:hypothetical protein
MYFLFGLHFFHSSHIFMAQDNSAGTVTRSKDRMPVGATFSACVHTTQSPVQGVLSPRVNDQRMASIAQVKERIDYTSSHSLGLQILSG